MNGILQVIITKVAEIFSARACGAREKYQTFLGLGRAKKHVFVSPRDWRNLIFELVQELFPRE